MRAASQQGKPPDVTGQASALLRSQIAETEAAAEQAEAGEGGKPSANPINMKNMRPPLKRISKNAGVMDEQIGGGTAINRGTPGGSASRLEQGGAPTGKPRIGPRMPRRRQKLCYALITSKGGMREKGGLATLRNLLDEAAQGVGTETLARGGAHPSDVLALQRAMPTQPKQSRGPWSTWGRKSSSWGRMTWVAPACFAKKAGVCRCRPS